MELPSVAMIMMGVLDMKTGASRDYSRMLGTTLLVAVKTADWNYRTQ